MGWHLDDSRKYQHEHQHRQPCVTWHRYTSSSAPLWGSWPCLGQLTVGHQLVCCTQAPRGHHNKMPSDSKREEERERERKALILYLRLINSSSITELERDRLFQTFWSDLSPAAQAPVRAEQTPTAMPAIIQHIDQGKSSVNQECNTRLYKLYISHHSTASVRNS